MPHFPPSCSSPYKLPFVLDLSGTDGAVQHGIPPVDTVTCQTGIHRPGHAKTSHAPLPYGNNVCWDHTGYADRVGNKAHFSLQIRTNRHGCQSTYVQVPQHTLTHTWQLLFTGVWSSAVELHNPGIIAHAQIEEHRCTNTEVWTILYPDRHCATTDTHELPYPSHSYKSHRCMILCYTQQGWH